MNSKDEPFIAGADLIGCLNYANDVVVAGTASDKLYGMAEGLWEPNMVSFEGEGEGGRLVYAVLHLEPGADSASTLIFCVFRTRTSCSNASHNRSWVHWSEMHSQDGEPSCGSSHRQK